MLYIKKKYQFLKKIKKFFSFFFSEKNKLIYLFILTFFFIIFFSYKIYKYKNNNNVIIEFQNIIYKIRKNKKKIFIEEENFLNKNKNIYGTLIGLNLAKKYDLNKKYFLELNTLYKIKSFTKEENLNNLIKLRIFIVYMKQKNIILAKKAFSLLDKNIWNNVIKNYKI